MTYLPTDKYKAQEHLDYISNWTGENLMQINEAKCNFMVFTRTKENFATRLYVNDNMLDRISVTQLLEVWISEDMSWDKNCKEICKKA